MTIDLEAAVKYPMESDDWVKTVLIGGVLSLLSILLIPIFFVYGYFVRVLRAGMRDEPEPPVFDDWGTLFTEGLVAFVILFVYQLVPLIVFGVTVGGSMLGFVTGTDAGAGIGVIGLVLGSLLTFLLAIVFGYVGLVGVANYAREGSFGAGFDFDVIKEVCLDGAYAIPFLYGVGVMIVASVVVGVLNVVPILGAVVGVFVTFYAQIVAGRLWGMGFADARGPGPTSDAAPTIS